jgi:hypothetical protein
LRGCPNTYVGAYHEGWEHDISNEKWRLKNRKP